MEEHKGVLIIVYDKENGSSPSIIKERAISLQYDWFLNYTDIAFKYENYENPLQGLLEDVKKNRRTELTNLVTQGKLTIYYNN